MESSYPSSTMLLVLSVMMTLSFQINRRIKNVKAKKIVCGAVIIFSAFMVVGRLISGVHWVTDIIGSCFLSGGLYLFYKSIVVFFDEKYQGD
jgi:undecaprenyl-diphosphatase